MEQNKTNTTKTNSLIQIGVILGIVGITYMIFNTLKEQKK